MSPDSISLYVDICICTCSLFLRKNFAAGVYTLRPGLTHSINQVFISVTRTSDYVHVSDMYFCISVNVFVCRFSSISLPSLWCTLCGRVWLTGGHRVFTAWRHQTRDTATEAALIEKYHQIIAIICWVDFHHNIQDNLLQEIPPECYRYCLWVTSPDSGHHWSEAPSKHTTSFINGLFIQWRSKISSFFLQVLMFRGKSSQLPQCQQDYQVARDRKSPEEWLKHFNSQESFHFDGKHNYVHRKAQILMIESFALLTLALKSNTPRPRHF